MKERVVMPKTLKVLMDVNYPKGRGKGKRMITAPVAIVSDDGASKMETPEDKRDGDHYREVIELPFVNNVEELKAHEMAQNRQSALVQLRATLTEDQIQALRDSGDLKIDAPKKAVATSKK
jgi:hypothetical protein